MAIVTSSCKSWKKLFTVVLLKNYLPAYANTKLMET